LLASFCSSFSAAATAVAATAAAAAAAAVAAAASFLFFPLFARPFPSLALLSRSALSPSCFPDRAHRRDSRARVCVPRQARV